MSLISNMIARLSLDSRPFENGAATSRRTMKGLQAETLALHRRVLGLAAAYIGARGIVAALKSVTAAAAEQQAAERRLSSALALTGDATDENITAIKQYAAALQRQTTYGDEEILNTIAYAKALGLSTDKIGEATVAAMGLATAYDRDLGQAMKYIALAAKGETGQLKELGIVIDKNLSPQEKYNELIRQMAEKWSLATDATRDAVGMAKRLNNTWGDTKEVIGEALLPEMQRMFQAMHDWLEQNQSDVRAWAGSTVDAIRWVARTFGEIQDTVVGDRANQWIEHTAKDRYRNQSGEENAFRNTWVGQGWGGHLEMTPPKDPAAFNRIKEQLRRENEDLLTSFPAQKSLPGTYAMPVLNVTGSGEGGAGSDDSNGAGAGADLKEISRLNAELKRRIAIERELAAGNRDAAETVKFRMAAEEAFGKRTKEAEAAVIKYASAMGKLNELQGAERVKELLAAMEAENKVLGLIREGRHAEARVLEIVNDLKRQGVDVSVEQAQRIRDLVAEHEALAEGADKSTVDVAAAYVRMYDDIDSRSAASWQARRALLDAEYAEYDKHIKDKAALDEWYAARKEQLAIAEAKAGNDIGGGIRAALSEMNRELGGLGKLSFDLTVTGINGITTSLADAVFESKNLGESLRELGRDMARMAFEWAVKKAIVGSLAMAFPMPSARGNVFDTSGVVRMARGGIVDQPTLFPFARGTGLMGEAGPEGILPLDRDSQGRLGVHATGGGDSGRTEALLGEIVGLLRRRQTLNLSANIVDNREVVTRSQMEGREGEQWTMYHAGRNQ